MSEEQKVNQPQNDVQEAEVKKTETDNKPQPQFTQEQLDNIIKQRLEAEKAKNERNLAEMKAKEEEAQKEKAIK